MPWALLADLRVWLAAALIATGLYAAVQRLLKEQAKVEFAQYRADVEKEAAASRVRAAQEAARQAQAAQEAVDALQTRYVALSARYDRLRSRPAGTVLVPGLSAAAPLLGACPGDAGKPDPYAGFLAAVEGRVAAIAEACDRELAKFVELWRLDQAKASP